MTTFILQRFTSVVQVCFGLLTSLIACSPVHAQIVLNNGQATNINLPSGGQIQYVFYVPSETKSVSFKLSGGSGNADLYVQQARPASTSSYYAKSTGPSNEEHLANLASHSTYYILLNAVSAVQGASLVASIQASDWFYLSSGVPVNNISLASNTARHFSIYVPAGKNKLTVQLNGGTGDGDLYSKFGSPPSISNYEKRSMGASNTELITIDKPRTGIHHIMIHAYSSVQLTTLKATIQ